MKNSKKRLTLMEFKNDSSLSEKINGNVFGAGQNECEVPCEVPCPEEISYWDLLKAAVYIVLAVPK